jgi:hypothetical protein
MSVASTHPVYAKFLKLWQRCRDVVEGEDAVKDKDTTYLPKLSGMDDLGDWQLSDYKQYKARALFFEAAARTVESLVGSMMRKPHTYVMPTAMEEWKEDMTGDGITIDGLVQNLLHEALTTGRVGLLVDMPQINPDNDDSPQLDIDDIRPVVSVYIAENITNWYGEDDDTKGIVLKECYYEPDPTDPEGFALMEATRYRELRMTKDGYEQRIWKSKQRGVSSNLATATQPPTSSSASIEQDQWEIVEIITPTMRGARMTELPFYWIGAKDNTTKCDKPPVLALANVNLSHYRTSADLEHGLHFTALPTPYISGAIDPDKKLCIGSTAAWILPEGSSAGYLEFHGDGLGTLMQALTDKSNMMAVLGARLIREPKRGVESAETAKINQSGEASTLHSIANTVEAALEKALRMMAQWAILSVVPEDEVSVQLNRDFIEMDLDAQQLTSLVAAWQAGAYTHETLLYNLEKRQMLPPEITIDDEIAKTQQEGDEAAAKLKKRGLIPGLQPPKPGEPPPAPGGDQRPGLFGYTPGQPLPPRGGGE